MEHFSVGTISNLYFGVMEQLNTNQVAKTANGLFFRESRQTLNIQPVVEHPFSSSKCGQDNIYSVVS